MSKFNKEYYERYPSAFIEDFFGIKLLEYQKKIINVSAKLSKKEKSSQIEDKEVIKCKIC